MKKHTYLGFISLCVSALILCGAEAKAKDIRERIYIHTDKQIYLAGELLWMKLYLTDEKGKPEGISKIGYVELLDEATSQVQAKIDLRNGVGEGWLELPATLPTGNYCLVGYTRYMENEGEAVFFNKTVSIINTFRTDKTLELADNSMETELSSTSINNINLSTDRTTYPLRTPGLLTIKGIPGNVHSLSLSISGNEIKTNQPPAMIRTWSQNLRRQSLPVFSGKVMPEYEGHIIRGKVINHLTGEDTKAQGILPLLSFVGDDIRLFGGQTGNSSQVNFYTKRIRGKEEIVTAAVSPEGNRYRIDIESPFFPHSDKELLPFKLDPAWQEQLLQRSVGMQLLHVYNADSLSRLEGEEPYFRVKPDWSYVLDEYTRFTTMEEIVIEFIIGLRFRRINNRRVLTVLTEEGTGFSIGNSLVLLDGIPIMDHEVIFRYDPLAVRQVDVYKGKYTFGGQLFDGIASFRTYQNNYPGLSLDNTTQFFDYEGTQARRIFYAPDYSDESLRDSRIPDYRHTLLWEPDIYPETSGELTIPFTTSDLKGEFLITVEGITEEGEGISGTYTFNVE